MRAVVVRTYGGPEALELIDVPTPEAGAGQIRIKVGAAAVNPVDAATRAGAFAAMLGERPSVGVGWDLAGTVDAIGSGVTDLAVGDAVIALLDLIAVDLGAYADYVVVDAAAVALAPRTVGLVAAATVPLNALTAEQALDLIDLEAGQSLLVTGAAGGLGGYLVELASRRGLQVVAVAGAADEQLVRDFGASHFIARTDRLAAALRDVVPGGVDGAIDSALVGAEALNAVRDGGRFVAVTVPDTPQSERGITVLKVSIHHDGAQLAELVRLVDAGEISTRVAATLPLEQAAEAHRQLDKGGVRGRLVLVT